MSEKMSGFRPEPKREAPREMRITDDELMILKSVFGGNDNLLKLLRKIFLPELSAATPLGENIDLWMTFPIDNMSTEEAIINLKARNSLITHLERQLMVLKVLAGSKEESVEETKKRLQQDSTR
jgi:hypothetical protein